MPAAAGLDITIEPSGGNVLWTVEWTDLTGANPAANFAWGSMDPATGGSATPAPWGAIPQVFYTDVGDPFSATFLNGNSFGFGDGADGVVSNPNGWGVGPWYFPAAGVNDDWVFLFNTLGNPIPSAGMFTLTVPGANIDKYNVGVYTNNANATVTVSAVPEPSSFAFLGLISVVVAGWQWKKRPYVA